MRSASSMRPSLHADRASQKQQKYNDLPIHHLLGGGKVAPGVVYLHDMPMTQASKCRNTGTTTITASYNPRHRRRRMLLLLLTLLLIAQTRPLSNAGPDDINAGK